MIQLITLFILISSSFAGTWNEDKFESPEGSRKFRFYTPDGMRGKRPLLLALHGCVQGAEDFAGLAKLEKLAEENKIYLLLPRQSRLSNPNGCWNWFSEKNLERDSGEPSLIMGMVKSSLIKFSIDTNRIYVMGPSAGGGMTSILLATYPDFFAAGMIGAGTMHRAADGIISGILAARSGSSNDPHEMALLGWESMRGRNISLPRSLPVLVFHGEKDNACHPLNSVQSVDQFLKWNDLLDDGLDNNSVSEEPTSVEKLQVPGGYSYTVKNYGTKLKYILVNDMGHGWSGGDDKFSFNFSKGPDQTAIMWDFFRKHVKSPTSH